MAVAFSFYFGRFLFLPRFFFERCKELFFFPFLSIKCQLQRIDMYGLSIYLSAYIFVYLSSAFFSSLLFFSNYFFSLLFFPLLFHIKEFF